MRRGTVTATTIAPSWIVSGVADKVKSLSSSVVYTLPGPSYDVIGSADKTKALSSSVVYTAGT